MSEVRELKILRLIELVTKEPYKLSVFKLAPRCKLPVKEILELTEKLNLEVMGHEAKNKRRDIVKFIEYNPECTAKDIMRECNATMTMVYDVVKRLGVRLENDWTKRERRLVRKKDPLVFNKYIPISSQPYKMPKNKREIYESSL